MLSPIPLGLSDPEASIHPLANTKESSSWSSGQSQVAEDYRAFKEGYGRSAQAIEGAVAMKAGGKVGKVVGATLVLGAVVFGSPEINGTQGGEGSFGPDKGDREPLPSGKQQGRGAIVNRGDVAPKGELDRAAPVGDKMQHHEIPSNAAIRAAREAELGAPLSRKERVALQKTNTAVAIPDDLHEDLRTTGGRNTKTQVLTDSKDLKAAERLDLRNLANKALEKGTFLRDEVAKILRDVRAVNRRRGI